MIRDPVDQRDGDHGTWRRPIRPAEPISRIPYEWSDRAVARTTPALLGLYSLVALWADAALRASRIDGEAEKVPRAVLDRLTDLACYAA